MKAESESRRARQAFSCWAVAAFSCVAFGAFASMGWGQSGSPEGAQALRERSAELLQQQKYDAALQAAEQALAAAERDRGADDLETASALHQLAEVYAAMGQYAKALPPAQRALAIRERRAGEESRAAAESLNDLGVLYLRMGDDASALALIQRAKNIRERMQRSTPADNTAAQEYAETLGNLGAVLLRLKRLDDARTSLELALQIQQQTYPAGDPHIKIGHNNLAAVYLAMSREAKTDKEREEFQRQANEHTALATQKEDTDTAKKLITRAWSLWRTDQAATDQVGDLFRQALAMREKMYGAQHPETAQSQVLLAIFDEHMGNFSQALALFQRALATEDEVLANTVTAGDEDQKLAYVEAAQGHYYAALSLVHQHLAADPAAVRFALDLVLRRKGIILDVELRQREGFTKHLGGDALATWRRLTKNQVELSKLLIGGPAGKTAADYRRDLERLQNAVAQDEQSLASGSPLVAQEVAQRQVTAEQVAKHLPPESALVEFVRMRDWDEKNLGWRKVPRYLAFVLTPDNQVRLVDLGEAPPLDAKIAATLDAIRDPQAFDNPSRYQQKTNAALADLYQVLIQPLEAAVAARRLLIVSPDGDINKVPFAALRTPVGTYLTEQTTVSFVSSGRDLLRGAVGVQPTLSLLLAANPAFDDKEAIGKGPRTERAFRPTSLRGTFGPLPGTGEEAKVIEPLILGNKSVLLGKAATESAVRSARSPRVLHLATHGFFLPDVTDSPSDPTGRSARSLSRGEDADPLRRSGLALAGANYHDTVAGGDDGILLAEEVGDMDLYGTDLAVLSACETALGEVHDGEGVYGLRRAFVLAGARNLVMSLWPVDDEVTRDLMGRFYRAYRGGAAAPAALHQAQLETIASLRTTEKDGQGQPVTPVTLWAPFIVQQTGE